MSDQDRAHRADQAHRADLAWYPRFARVVWHATAPLRHALHRSQGAEWWCPTQVAPYSAEDPGGSAAAQGCADCVSEHGEILCLTCRRYAEHRAEVADPDGWAYRVAEFLTKDRFRRLRVETGALARIDSRGVVARVYGACATEWESRLARLVLGYVGMCGPVPADVWPYAAWLAEKEQATGVPQEGSRARGALHDDILLVLAVMKAVGGHVTVDGERMTWAEAYVERPLGRRRRVDTVRLDGGSSTGDDRPPIDPPDPGLVRGFADRLVVDCRVLVRQGYTVDAALRRVLPDLFGAKGYEVIGDRARMARLVKYVRSELSEHDTEPRR